MVVSLDFRNGSQLAFGHDALAALLGDNDVIQNANTDQFANFGKPVGDSMILPTGRRVTRRMVMHQ